MEHGTARRQSGRAQGMKTDLPHPGSSDTWIVCLALRLMAVAASWDRKYTKTAGQCGDRPQAVSSTLDVVLFLHSVVSVINLPGFLTSWMMARPGPRLERGRWREEGEGREKRKLEEKRKSVEVKEHGQATWRTCRVV